MTITMTKEALLERLNENLRRANAEDEKALKKHREDEQNALKRFRAILRDALTWDYKKAKARYFNPETPRVPTCPVRQAENLERIIKSIKMSTIKGNWSIRTGSDIYDALHWMPESEKKKTVCD